MISNTKSGKDKTTTIINLIPIDHGLSFPDNF